MSAQTLDSARKTSKFLTVKGISPLRYSCKKLTKGCREKNGRWKEHKDCGLGEGGLSH